MNRLELNKNKKQPFINIYKLNIFTLDYYSKVCLLHSLLDNTNYCMFQTRSKIRRKHFE
ncbi:uncharacterized protein BX663DRAFT_499933 [Cokeromyces recurvatus]|uniref:uncharacterized protein n=1 Tax=Cokeromyces recurvatus TaxID=90255 RepID=UPI00221ECEAE|nr:uncharacterized protein BX663DRAFT_499933 [Cokeromyces recurvatus]KAI7905494.1 hypothetical protein BX663DRAFT_499933 [Cokeromyces recurvatus]